MVQDIIKFCISIAVPLTIGFIGSFATTSAVNGWYAEIIKPTLNPPSWVFGPVWTTLYILMGIAVFLVWRYGWQRGDVRVAVLVFALQLTLNGVWPIIFFGLQSLAWALVTIIILIAVLIWTMTLFYSISRTAMYLLVPYLAWLLFAIYLNTAIVFLN